METETSKGEHNTLYTVAFILNFVIWAVIFILYIAVLHMWTTIIQLAWIIPMSVHTWKVRDDNQKHTALGVCTLIFVNIISGILILVGPGEKK